MGRKRIKLDRKPLDLKSGVDRRSVRQKLKLQVSLACLNYEETLIFIFPFLFFLSFFLLSSFFLLIFSFFFFFLLLPSFFFFFLLLSSSFFFLLRYNSTYLPILNKCLRLQMYTMFPVFLSTHEFRISYFAFFPYTPYFTLTYLNNKTKIMKRIRMNNLKLPNIFFFRMKRETFILFV